MEGRRELTMAEYAVTARIDAPPAVVWSVLSDVRAMPTWTPTMRKVVPLSPEPLGVGSRVQIDQPKMPRAVWEVERWQPGAGFSWVTRSPGVRTRGDHVLAPAAGGASEVTLAVTHDGPLAGIVWALTGRRTRAYVDRELAGLAARCADRIGGA
jgi:uncharacterized membrane protein